MGRLIFGMMQSLDGYIAGPSGELLPPGPILHRHFNDYVRGLDGVLYSRRMYEVMRYWAYVLGTGKPYFAGSRPPLRLMKFDAIGEDAVRLTYVPA